MAGIMTTPTDEVTRLDMAARAKSCEAFVSRLRWILLLLSLFFVALAIGSTASFYETLFVRAAAALAGFTTVVLWSNFRYKLYFPPLLFLSLGIGGAFFNFPTHRIFDRIGWLCGFVGAFVLPSYHMWRQAGIFATVNTPEWDKERSLVDAWWRTLTAPETDKKGIIEFSTGNFWSGYYTYRLMSPGRCWVVAKLWKGKVAALSDYRVRKLSGVTFAATRNGETKVTIEGRTINAANVFPPMFGVTEASSLAKGR